MDGRAVGQGPPGACRPPPAAAAPAPCQQPPQLPRPAPLHPWYSGWLALPCLCVGAGGCRHSGTHGSIRTGTYATALNMSLEQAAAVRPHATARYFWEPVRWSTHLAPHSTPQAPCNHSPPALSYCRPAPPGPALPHLPAAPPGPPPGAAAHGWRPPGSHTGWPTPSCPPPCPTGKGPAAAASGPAGSCWRCGSRVEEGNVCAAAKG